jgi:hypothetical protein
VSAVDSAVRTVVMLPLVPAGTLHCCGCPDGCGRTWLLDEAGALAKHWTVRLAERPLVRRVVPYPIFTAYGKYRATRASGVGGEANVTEYG